MDKINRLQKPAASQGLIKYGDGNVFFETNGEVAGFEIDYIGAIKGVKRLGQGWTIKIGKRKAIIYSMAQSELSELLFTYVGEFEITKCKYVTWDLQMRQANVVNVSRDTWNSNYGEYQSDARKPEEIVSKTIIGREIKKSSI
jgi:hypothetical protein|tara:strand:- start:242 stop:670 length:429 start_codon:yes stop_codon:yes gene_type:complete